MPHRYESPAETRFPLPAIALRATLARGYRAADVRADLLAGITVGIVALPLSMALAIACGVPPQHGLYTAIVAGALIAAAGGSMVQVSGPTAAFVVILAPIAAKFGLGGLMVATMLAGVFLMVMGLARLGGLIQFIPHPVTTGFTAGIAVVIATLQVKDLLGLTTAALPGEYLERLQVLVRALPTLRWEDAAIGLLTLALLVLWPRVTKKVPAPLVALSVAAIAAAVLRAVVPGFEVATIASRFHYVLDGKTLPGIPQLPPLPTLPWTLPGPDGRPLGLSLALVRELAPSGLAIAMLGAIESLLSAVVADGMTRGKHDPDAELLAQGTGNLLGPLFGGFAATGAIARTATNVRAGARSPFAAIFHSIFVLAAMLALAPILGTLPMAALAAQLIIVAWNMSEAKHFAHMLRVAPKSDVTVLVACFGLTVFFDMVIAVTVGVMLAALLFMRRMAEVTGVELVGSSEAELAQPLPESVLLYEIGGPLFFGAAEKAMSRFHSVQAGVEAVILDMTAVPAMDATGLVSLESALARLHEAGIFVVVAGVQPQPWRVLAKAGLRRQRGKLALARSLDNGVAAALAHVAGEDQAQDEGEPGAVG